MDLSVDTSFCLAMWITFFLTTRYFNTCVQPDIACINMGYMRRVEWRRQASLRVIKSGSPFLMTFSWPSISHTTWHKLLGKSFLFHSILFYKFMWIYLRSCSSSLCKLYTHEILHMIGNSFLMFYSPEIVIVLICEWKHNSDNFVIM